MHSMAKAGHGWSGLHCKQSNKTADEPYMMIAQVVDERMIVQCVVEAQSLNPGCAWR